MDQLDLSGFGLCLSLDFRLEAILQIFCDAANVSLWAGLLVTRLSGS